MSAQNDDCSIQLPLQVGEASSLGSRQWDRSVIVQQQVLGMFLRKRYWQVTFALSLSSFSILLPQTGMLPF